MKAFILAAGKGERLKPLTNNTPKPLIPVKGKPLLEWNLLKLKSAGITDVVINLHYLGDKIINYFGDGRNLNLNIQYSMEQNLLGTGGALIQGNFFLDDSPFILLSGDLWTNYPFSRLVTKVLESKAHLVLIKDQNKPKGDFNLVDSKISTDIKNNEFTYSGISLIDPSIIPNEEPTSKELWKDILESHVKQKQLSGEVFHGLVKNINNSIDLEQLDVAITE